MNRDRLTKCKILVTGASGFIGSHLCSCLSKTAGEVHGISRVPRQGNEDNVRWWQGDLSDFGTTRRLMTAIKPDIVYHLAGYGTGLRDLELVLPTFQNNLVLTVNLLKAAAEIGFKRLIFVGSLEEPDACDGNIVPSSPYAAAKWASSVYVRMFHELYNMPTVIVRVFMSYGPGQSVNKVIPYVILSLLQGQTPKLSSGAREVDWIYVDDVVSGLLSAAYVDGLEGRTLDLGSGKLNNIRTVVGQLVYIMNSKIEPKFGAIPDRVLEQVRVADAATSKALMGWQPVILLPEGLEKTVNWYKESLLDSVLELPQKEL